MQQVLEKTKPVEIYTPDIEQKYGFNAGFKACCRTLYKRVREDFDAVVAITGEEGISKSTLANHIGFATDKKYTLAKNVLYNPTERGMVDAIKKMPRFSAINGDEAIKILYKQQWWLQTFINMFYRLCRQDNKITILCMPRFAEFNEGFRNHRILLWIHLLDRGFGIAFMKDWNPFTKDPWHTDENDRIVRKYMKGRKLFHISLQRKVNILKKSPNFLDVVTFPDLSPEVRIEYKRLAATNKYKGLDDELRLKTRKTKTQEKLEKRMSIMKGLLKEKTGMSDNQIAKAMGTSRQTASRV